MSEAGQDWPEDFYCTVCIQIAAISQHVSLFTTVARRLLRCIAYAVCILTREDVSVSWCRNVRQLCGKVEGRREDPMCEQVCNGNHIHSLALTSRSGPSKEGATPHESQSNPGQNLGRPRFSPARSICAQVLHSHCNIPCQRTIKRCKGNHLAVWSASRYNQCIAGL